MKILGTGIISSSGRGLTSQSNTPTPETPGIHRVNPETLKDKATLKNMRRADRFSKMAVLAAHDALTDANFTLAPDDKSLGIIATTAFGPHNTTFKFLDDILDFSDTEVSPTKFSHSVHNAAASYIASAIGSRGPTTTVTKFNTALTDGLMLANAWLSEKRCNHVLLGYIEEISPAMEHINSELSKRGDILQKFNISQDPDATLSEGAIFLLLSNEDNSAPTEISNLQSLLTHLGT